uniref:Acetyl-coenzyme A synthetase N-terminal domain-containing protein n=1 Tax=Timema genevievae TaxID=629358 RepID=A0A7R9PNT8_TIMGE|nr:unnamed protein product [Timema genevievae]
MSSMAKEVYLPDPSFSSRAHVSSIKQYKDLYQKSIDSPDEFWSDVAKQFHWETPVPSEKFYSYNFDLTKGPIHIKWMEGATTNICYNLLDKNVRNGLGDKIAFYCQAFAGGMKAVVLGLTAWFGAFKGSPHSWVIQSSTFLTPASVVEWSKAVILVIDRTDIDGEIGVRIPVMEEFGNQINLCWDRGLNPEPPALKSDTLPLDRKVTKV